MRETGRQPPAGDGRSLQNNSVKSLSFLSFAPGSLLLSSLAARHSAEKHKLCVKAIWQGSDKIQKPPQYGGFIA
jgi:hypothetical protein